MTGLRDLKEEKLKYQNKLEKFKNKNKNIIAKVWIGIISSIDKYINQIEEHITKIISSEAELVGSYNLLKTMPGIRDTTAWGDKAIKGMDNRLEAINPKFSKGEIDKLVDENKAIKAKMDAYVEIAKDKGKFMEFTARAVA